MRFAFTQHKSEFFSANFKKIITARLEDQFFNINELDQENYFESPFDLEPGQKRKHTG